MYTECEGTIKVDVVNGKVKMTVFDNEGYSTGFSFSVTPDVARNVAYDLEYKADIAEGEADE